MLERKFLLALPLMALLLSGCNRNANTAEKASANLKSIGLAALMYCQDYDERFPDMSTPETVKAALLPYAKLEEYFINPSTGRPFQPNTALSRMYNTDIANPASTILFYEDAPYDDGTRGVVYANGYVAAVPESN